VDVEWDSAPDIRIPVYPWWTNGRLWTWNGRGFGRGWFRGGYARLAAYGNPPVDVPAISEKEALKQQSDYLKQQLKQIDDRLDQIKED
jgi:hypothetical protein